MPSITLYVKEADQKIIEKAKTKLGDSLSSIFVDCVRERIEHVSQNRRERKIALLFWNDNQQPVIKKSFIGSWLIGDENEGIRAEQPESVDYSWDMGIEYSVALSKQGNLVVYWRHSNDRYAPRMEMYKDFEEMKEATNEGYPSYPENVIAETAAALGKPHEIELDI